MTDDTRRALEAIIPIANELKIKVDADDEFLYCNDVRIGIIFNSTYATIKEFIGYVMNWLCDRDSRFDMPKSLADQIRRYWVYD